MAFKCPDHKQCNPEYAWSLHYIMGELFLALHVCMHTVILYHLIFPRVHVMVKCILSIIICSHLHTRMP